MTSKQTADSSERNQSIHDFLSTHPIGVLATADPNGEPHAAVLYFSIDKNFEIMFTTKSETKKHDNLQHNPHAMLVSYEASSQTTVQVTGSVEEVTDPDLSERILAGTTMAAMQTSESGVAPIAKLEAGDYVAYTLQPTHISMAVFARPDPGGYDMYETIDF